MKNHIKGITKIAEIIELDNELFLLPKKDNQIKVNEKTICPKNKFGARKAILLNKNDIITLC